MSPILLNLYDEYLNNKSLEGFWDFKIEQIIHTVICTDELVLLAKEEIVLKVMTDRLIKIGCCGKEMNVEKIK